MATAQENLTSFAEPTDPISPPEIEHESPSRMVMEISGEMQIRLEDLIRRSGYDLGELFNVAIALFKVGLDAVEDGYRVGIVDDDREMSLDFTGFHKNDPPGEPF